MQAVGTFWFPMMGIASFWSQFQDGLAAAERVFALIDLEPKVLQKDNRPLDAIKGEITFRNVCFRYTEKEIVLPDFSLTIQPGENLALVGHTGAGKTSIANLIARFYEFQDGEILIDGVDIRQLNLAHYRRHIGLVPQEPFLFSASVADNIRYAQPDATDKQVMEAAMHISQGEWLKALPEGLETDAGERGANLSMGQRQLVALARVLLKDPSILILDEATASVDPFTETQIQEGLRCVMADRTSVVIAHRLWTIQNADRIIVMENGRIIAEGTHETLMAAGGHYAELYNTYFRHQSLEYIETMGR
jgi:ATP-binding cassette subfamily B protein